MFVPNKISRLKKLFEGKGWQVEVKFQDPEHAYDGAFVYMSSNRLPKIATEYEEDSLEFQDMWEPFTERCEFVQHLHQFTSCVDKPEFDYTHICHLWLLWHSKYADIDNVPKLTDVPKLDGDFLCKKRNKPSGARIDAPGYKRKTLRDIGWERQTLLKEPDAILDCIPASLPSMQGHDSCHEDIVEQAQNEYLMDGIAE